MALTSTTKFANRYGLNVYIFEYTNGDPGAEGDELVKIDFANVSTIDISGDRTWATGGQDHSNKIGFNNPLEGTFTLQTQIMTTKVLEVMAGKTPTDTTEVVFDNTTNSMPKYFTITAETVWQDDMGLTYTENMTFHKASPQRAINLEYTGEGDPASVDIVFDLLQDGSNRLLSVNKVDTAAAEDDEEEDETP